jgi:hypothetical protein
MEATRESHDAMQGRTRRIRHATVLVAVCAAAATLLTPAVASANSNGQQLSFSLGLRGAAAGWGP